MSAKAKFALTVGIVIGVIQYVYTMFVAPMFSSTQVSSIIKVVIDIVAVLLVYLIFNRLYDDF
ncbi:MULTISPECIES: hypothetical protein [Lactobacillaceae]|uniref:hypothetical protein n=1 Tax=Lactobacillales TaxID=186826 RepID=UPI001109DEA6|nr:MULTISPECIES: hypothetical protein [Lactobacillaceae]MBF7138833.1 hypothetical protein [Pediococcus pentosaceus]MCT0161675.1 hypothetical protein [Lactiplantibacillus pentosus]TLP98443.1 hypothetical protein FEZ50_09990 [Pediococcus pentosaceus]